MRTPLIVFLILLIEFVGCGSFRRVHIVFENPLSDVRDSMFAMRDIMDELGQYRNIRGYYCDREGSFWLDGNFLGELSRIYDDSLRLMEGVSLEGRARFAILVQYLKT